MLAFVYGNGVAFKKYKSACSHYAVQQQTPPPSRVCQSRANSHGYRACDGKNKIKRHIAVRVRKSEEHDRADRNKQITDCIAEVILRRRALFLIKICPEDILVGAVPHMPLL